ncbi:MAG: MltA domain-containing protein [Cyanobacteria bacterium P01_F01_bin.13]
MNYRRWRLRAILVAALACAPLSAIAFPLDLVNCHIEFVDQACLGYDAQFGQDRAALLQAIDHSLDYLATEAAITAYEDYPLAGITHDRVQLSLVRFRQLVATSHSAQQLQSLVSQEFEFYRSVGSDGSGHVDFTGYFEPTYSASTVPTSEYRYPLYSRPVDLDAWQLPHPTRAALEGIDGLQGGEGPLASLELVWLQSRLEAFLVQVQGSARLQLTDGSVMSVGYAGRTEYPYTSIGRALIDDGIVAEADLTLPVLMDYFEQHPAALDSYLPRNDRFVFFKATGGSPPIGNLNVPVTPGRSIATDKTLMPPGALALISLELPVSITADSWQAMAVNRFVLDQDTGGAIRGPGRVDIFVGTGDRAGQQAGLINTSGQLYYLLLRQ